MERLTRSDKILCAVYGVLALAALVGTQVVLVDYVRSGDGSLVDDLFANGAATFVVIDLLAVAAVGLVFMVVEARRVGVRYVWIYVLLTFTVAISVALPLFLIARQLRLAGDRDVTTASR